jgi:hypothetical protein
MSKISRFSRSPDPCTGRWKTYDHRFIEGSDDSGIIVIATQHEDTVVNIATKKSLTLNLVLSPGDLFAPFVNDVIEFIIRNKNEVDQVSIGFGNFLCSQSRMHIPADGVGIISFRFIGESWHERFRTITKGV